MQTIYLNLNQRNDIPILFAKQKDVGRKFKAIISDGSEDYQIPGDVALSVWYSGTSGEGNYSTIGSERSAFSVEGNTVTVELIAQMLTNKGGGMLSLMMHSGAGVQIGLWNIHYIVEELPGAGSAQAQQYYDAFSETVSQTLGAVKRAEELASTFAVDSSLMVAGHAADAAAVGTALAGKAPNGYGLGANTGGSFVNDFNNAMTNGWYCNYGGSANAPWIHGGLIFVKAYSEKSIQQTALTEYYGGITAERWMVDDAWQAWEYVNPPMIAGVEYRTTKRWNGKAVYTQMRAGLTLPNAGIRDIPFYIPNNSSVIRYRHIAYGPDMCELPMASGSSVIAYGYFAQSDDGLIYRYKTSADLTNYTESYIQVWYTKE